MRALAGFAWTVRQLLALIIEEPFQISKALGG
ncbi:hypothetical protein FUAX_31150 [Fulvitalea axinellae]|uniref:Uncharacterized protein n=1 Tax=Fulvitalea axinellae TaxID=1182444 RepID=A0AAU9CRF2_9BACT|nr:hypothetical protein FUAX_31150 [Fulvitalea axinellae]